MTGPRVPTRSTKYDGSRHWEYNSLFVLQEGPLLITRDAVGDMMQNKNRPWRCPYHTRNHYWTDRWYNVMRFERPDRGLDHWYCNVSTPARFDDGHLRWVDLDLDVRVWPDGRMEVLDEDEFLENSACMGYPPAVIASARNAVGELLALARSAQFPFEELAGVPARQARP